MSKIHVLYLISLLFLFSCEQKNADTLFSEIPTSISNITFANILEENEDFNIIEYLYFYNGGGIAAGDINNDGFIDLYFTSNQGEDELYLNKGNFEFENITAVAQVGGENGIQKWTTAATMVDINADGWLDIYVCEVSNYKILKGKNRLYINQKDLTFREAAAEYGLDISTYSQQATFLDYDVDGDLDMFLLNHAVHTPDSYKKAEIRTIRDSLAGDRLYRNEGGKFLEVTEEAGIYNGAMGYGLSVSVADVNNDRFPDIYVTNDFHENDYLYINQGNGKFEESIQQATGHLSTFSMGSDIADFNNDGWLDIMTMDMKPDQESILKNSAGVDPFEIYQYKLSFGYHHQYSRNVLQLNRGKLSDLEGIRFSEIGQYSGIAATDWSWSTLFADLDNDGQKDIFITNGIPARPNDLDYIRYLSNSGSRENLPATEMIQNMPDGRYSNFAFQYKNRKYEDVSEIWGLNKNGYSNGAIYADLDQDGDLDLVTNNWGEKASVFENNSTERIENHYLQILLKGDAQNSNGIGARVGIYANKEYQIIENHVSRGWLSSVNSPILHFGLGESQQVDSVVVRWSNGNIEVLKNIAVNQLLEVDIKNAKQAFPRVENSQATVLEKVKKSGIDFKHQEIFANDFSNEKLLPRLMSTEGPKLAVGDVNNDGLDDFYIGGGKGQSGALYLQKERAIPFQKAGISTFQQHALYEDTDATFFDADQDGDLDLYVVSGGQQKMNLLQDRLYFNDGNGNFKATSNALPTMNFNGSCVVPLDIDEDGKLDLFIGNQFIAGSYGQSGKSVLLRNEGNGQFTNSSEIHLSELGMVTDAVWLEDRRELMVVGEWMPVTILDFLEKEVQKKEIKNSKGWWKTIATADIEGDGDLDILLGNEGLNTNLAASPKQPLELYVDDYDGNQSSDPIMAYYKNGKQWVYPDLDLLSKQIVSVRKTYNNYDSYSKSTFSEVFPPAYLKKSIHRKVETLASSWLEYSDGKYILKPLPDETQWSSLQAFTAIDAPNKGILAVGNFYGNTTSMGKSDASFGNYLKWDGEKLVSIPLQEVGFAIEGECRDIQVLEANRKGKWILVTRNNMEVVLYAIQN